MLSKSKVLYFGLFLFLIINSVQAKPSKDADAKTDKSKDEGDSDMLMKPNSFDPITILRSQEQQFHEPLSTQFRAIPTEKYSSKTNKFSIPPINPIDSHSQAAQNYHPPFFREAPPLGHSRPYFTIADASVIPKYTEVGLNGNLGPGLPANQKVAGFDHTILGSGNFGVIRGGTFYPEEEMPYHPEDSVDFVQKYTYPEEQFAHFRDFADINTPVDTAFSHFMVVYQAKNSTKPRAHSYPKNIFEQLELLDQEKANEEKKLKKTKQVSKLKTKLAKTKLQQKKYKKKSPPPTEKDSDEEPLLALS